MNPQIASRHANPADPRKDYRSSADREPPRQPSAICV